MAPFCQGTGNAFSSVIRMRSDVGNEIDALAITAKGDKTGISNDVTILFPDKTRKGHRCALDRVAGPAREGRVTAGTPHLPDV